MDVVVSAPGKVLITGGYLVLEKPNSGLVLSTSARFFASVRPMNAESESNSWAWSWADVTVSSPQLFKETAYKLSLRDYTLKQVSPPASEGGNPFVENAIQMAIAASKIGYAGDSDGENLLATLLLKGMSITILGSNAFYSFRKQIEAQNLPITAATLASLPEFSAITMNPSEPSSQATNGMSQPEVAKTGLGSSAAMTTAVVAGIMEYLGGVELPRHAGGVANRLECVSDLDLVHTIAQAAHSAAQGKIGSGFDVSAAVYGSQRYMRFSPSVLSFKGAGKIKSPLEEVSHLLEQRWDGERTEYALPPHLFLIIGEPGYGGSHTPSMVSAVLAWKKKDPDHESVWSDLATANKGVEAALSRLNYLAQKFSETYFAVLDSCGSSPSEQWENAAGPSTEAKEIVSTLLQARHEFGQVRSGLQQISERAAVPVSPAVRYPSLWSSIPARLRFSINLAAVGRLIEPPIQTKLLDRTMRMNGVLLAGVPGAGGYDAIFAITLGQSARERVEQEWNMQGVLSLPTNEDPCGVSLEDIDPRISKSVSALQAMSVV